MQPKGLPRKRLCSFRYRCQKGFFDLLVEAAKFMVELFQSIFRYDEPNMAVSLDSARLAGGSYLSIECSKLFLLTMLARSSHYQPKIDMSWAIL